jgi:copper transport protein
LRIGPNFVAVRVLDTRRPQPAPVTGVDLTLRQPDVAGSIASPRAPATRLDATDWEITSALSRTGPWAVDVVVHRTGLPDAATHLSWVLADTPSVPTARPFLVPSLVLVGAGLVAAAAWFGFRRLRLRSRAMTFDSLATPETPRTAT